MTHVYGNYSTADFIYNSDVYEEIKVFLDNFKTCKITASNQKQSDILTIERCLDEIIDDNKINDFIEFVNPILNELYVEGYEKNILFDDTENEFYVEC